MKYVKVEFKPNEQAYTFRCPDLLVQQDDMVVAPVYFPRASRTHLSLGIVLEVFDKNPSPEYPDEKLGIIMGIVNTFQDDEYCKVQVRQQKEQELKSEHIAITELRMAAECSGVQG